MHIPDGYLGPQTYLAAYAAVAPFWAAASRKLNRSLRQRQVPLLALGAAFSFVIMMFNVPIPGGTTGHAVGAVLVAVLLGPWAACVAVSIALILQAFLFGDGGITSIGANCLNMAVIMPFTGYGVYRLIAAGADFHSARRWIGAAAGGYVGLNAAALSTGIMFGLQPLLAHDAAGHALYAPYPLQLAVPAMAVEHLLLFGVVEALVTGMVVRYLQRSDPSLLFGAGRGAGARVALMKTTTKLWIGLAVLCLLSPLGLILPDHFKSGSAWGEWGIEEVKKMIGYEPEGMKREGEIYSAPLPDYGFKGPPENSLRKQSLAYIVSALIGVAAVAGAAMLIGRVLSRRDQSKPS